MAALKLTTGFAFSGSRSILLTQIATGISG